MKEVTMASKWIGGIHGRQVDKRWSVREKTYWYEHEDKSCNAGRLAYDMQLHVEFATEPTKEDWPSSVQRVRLCSVSTRAR